MSIAADKSYEHDRAIELVESWRNGNCLDVAVELHNSDSVLTAHVFVALAEDRAIDDMHRIIAALHRLGGQQ